MHGKYAGSSSPCQSTKAVRASSNSLDRCPVYKQQPSCKRRNERARKTIEMGQGLASSKDRKTDAYWLLVKRFAKKPRNKNKTTPWRPGPGTLRHVFSTRDALVDIVIGTMPGQSSGAFQCIALPFRLTQRVPGFNASRGAKSSKSSEASEGSKVVRKQGAAPPFA